MSEKIHVHLDTFTPRDYQLAACDAFENKGYKRMCLVWSRRTGKDVTAWNLTLRAAIRSTGVFYYCLPTFSQARKVIWDSIMNDGRTFLSFIPKELIKSMNSSELKITLINGSIIQLIGSDSYNTSLVGTNPQLCVFSEFALADEDAFKFVLPIINSNGGRIIAIGTPRGKNHFYDLYMNALNSPEWFCQKLTVEDTKHVTPERIQQDVDDGLISPDLIRQEFFCDFFVGQEGSYYAKYINNLRLKGQIGKLSWDPTFPTHTAWDIGYADSTCIIFFQLVGKSVHIINAYEKNKEGLEHYINVINSMPYSYGKHYGPHDLAVHDMGSGLSRLEKARQLGLKFETRENGSRSALPNLSIEDGIEAVRSSLPRMWFDEANCKGLIKSLENYRQEYNNKLKVYNNKPLHDVHSHYADAMRYLCLSLSNFRDRSQSAEELDRRYRETLSKYSNDGFPSMFPTVGPNGF